MMPLRPNVLTAIACLLLLAPGACGGDTVESDKGGGGSGGQIPDSGGQDAAEAAVEAGPDAAQDVSLDTAPDQSVEPDTGVVDGEVLEGSLFDMTMPDVALNDSGATLQGCYDCAIASCSSEMADCELDNTCRTVLLCLFEDQCFGGSTGIDFGCGMGCAQKAGITNPNDPAVSVALSAAQCISGNCQEDCALPADGGLPFDGGLPDGF